MQIQPAIRPQWPSRRTDHQPQHAVTPATGQLVVGLGQQVIHLIDPLRIDATQRLAGKIAPGIQVGQPLCTRLLVAGRPGEMRTQITRQQRPSTGVAGIEKEVLHIHREKLARITQLVAVRTARDLMIVLFTRATLANLLRPAGQIEQLRVITQGKAPRRLPTTIIRQANGAQALLALTALALQLAFGLRPELGAVIQVGELVQHGRQQFAAYTAVRA